jgi:LysM repeat protein
MSDFDDLLRNSKSEQSSGSSSESSKSGETRASNKKQSSANIASMFGASDMADLTRKFNLDPDMGERVLVPLVNFLEKYGVADAVDSSPTANRLLTMAEFWTDIAPVIKNASDFFGGRKNQLDDSDREFLERIRAAQSDSADMSLFQEAEDSSGPVISIGESVGSAPATTAAAPPVAPPPKDPFKDPSSVDWYKMMGIAKGGTATNQYEASSLNTRPQTEFGISGLEKLAAEAGLSVEEVMDRDSQNKINQKPGQGVDYTAEGGIPTFQKGVDKIQAQMKEEAEKHRRNSKVSYEDLPTPESAEKYDPLSVQGLDIPSLVGGGLESLDSLASKAGVSPEDLKTQPVGSKDPEPETITMAEISKVHEIGEVVMPENPDRPAPSTFLVDFDSDE